MEGLTLNSLPAWIPGIAMLYAGLMWLITIRSKVRMDSRISGYTMLVWGLMYLVSALRPDTISQDNLVMRVLFSRLVIILICAAQAIPLSVSYHRANRREDGGQ